MSDRQSLWQQLLAADIAGGEMPAPPPETDAPWAVRWLAGIGAWIAMWLLLGFIGSLFGALLSQSALAVVIGAGMAAVSLPWLRSAQGEFQRQAAIVVNLAGLLMLGFGLAAGLELDADPVAAILLVAAAGLYLASSSWLHRLFCAGIALACLFWLIASADDIGARLVWCQALAVWLAVALWLLRLNGDPHRFPPDLLEPLAWAAGLAALGLAWLSPWLPTLGAVDAQLPLLWPQLVTAAALPLIATVLVLPRREVLGIATSLGLIASAIALAWLWRWAPGITTAICLLLLSLPLGAVVLLALSGLSLAVSLVVYYYHLGDSLLAKSAALAIAGAIVLALHGVMLARERSAAP